MKHSTYSNVTIFFICFIFISAHNVFATNVSYDQRAVIIDGTRRILISGSIHYPRSTTQMWPDLVKKAKEGGLDVIETYIFWNAHETRRRHYDFSGDLDFIKFIKVIRDAGLYVFLRIGPYICGEWNYGGFPVWLHNIPGIKFRTDNKIFKDEMQNFTTLIVDMVKKEKLFASQGGPIILAQIENEYGDVAKAYGEAGKAYRRWCIELAESLNVGVPWVMCQDDEAPQPMLNAHDGYYSDQWTPNNPNSPKIWAENWIGWYKTWGDRDPHRAPEDSAFSIARFYQSGGTFMNYYMYHGGTNFGRTSGGPYVTTSYDYDAPLNEYGQYNQPKWGHFKKLHAILKSMEKPLTYGSVSSIDLGNNVTATIFATKERSSCFLSNVNKTNDFNVKFRGNVFGVPAWSVSILPDCKKEEYNTARVNSQTSVMAKAPDVGGNRAKSLKWSWRPEKIQEMVQQGKGNITAQGLIDQKVVASDRSDYLWYMTSVHIKGNDPVWSSKNTILKVNTTATIHAFVNGIYIGSQWGSYNISFPILSKRVKLHRSKKNLITLLSVTIGFQNYGPKFDLSPNGIVGPVELIRQIKGEDEMVIKDLSNRKWTYKVGLDGFDSKFYDPDHHSASGWRTDHLPTNRMMTWYKTTFKTPLGTDPVVVDLQGLGKGEAWVNGHSIGRYWPTFLAEKKGCENGCDYRSLYNSSQCLTNCGQPSQRWYHVPRSFMHEEENTLVLFEEFGGNPAFVHFRRVHIRKACANVYEKNTLELSCPGRSISGVKFASFGNPTGGCGSFEKGTCEGNKDALSIVKRMCVGKESCSIDVSERTFGSTGCGNNHAYRLAVEVVC